MSWRAGTPSRWIARTRAAGGPPGPWARGRVPPPPPGRKREGDGGDPPAAERQDPEGGPAPDLPEGVEPLLEKSLRGEEAAAGEVIEDLVVEEGVELPDDPRGRPRAGGRGAKAREPVEGGVPLAGGDGRGSERQPRDKESEDDPAIHGSSSPLSSSGWGSSRSS